MFLDIDKKSPVMTAMLDDQGLSLTYDQLCSFIDTFSARINRRTLVFILCENGVGTAAAYVASLASRIVPVLLSATLDAQLLANLVELYHPEFLWVPTAMRASFSAEPVYTACGYTLLTTHLEPFALHPDLALLLTTSGSTGSPKFVRHSYQNIEANARNVATVFALTNQERGMVSLPLQFTQGLNVATSHLQAGATILLSTAVLTQKAFWDFFQAQRATSFTGVPYSMEVLSRLRFFRMNLPDFKTLNQGGGRLPDALFQQCAEYAARTNRRFIATYGSTETTSRMAYLPPELALAKCGSIGRAIPEGQLTLVDDRGDLIRQSGVPGEIIYRGPNVTWGYAYGGADLVRGDERQGVYATGDQAWQDEDGCFYIIGRKNRFLKLYGYRVSLDETERLIRDAFKIECACTGSDQKLIVYTIEPSISEEIRQFLTTKTGLYAGAFEVRALDQLPKSESGKILYNELPR